MSVQLTLVLIGYFLNLIYQIMGGIVCRVQIYFLSAFILEAPMNFILVVQRQILLFVLRNLIVPNNCSHFLKPRRLVDLYGI